ncbi:bactofilin family protein [Oceanicoccus sagamiensis]|uniref:Cell shape determination protein CcmA n=1 Tax=Oceanicoccus sagamiensis TaxID=716816 RepID=A0A1X9NHP4_9GAMM|nr:polymer-forming cytoskeletal protein [Oceanicoccus sagamiensis]ARN74427.1 cell shape determination protein CcmA [Oceanicoccus sagamiensis]
MAFQSGNSTTLISKDSEIIGDIKFSGDLEVQGLVRGNIHASSDNKATVRIVEGGRVEGEIHAPKVIVNGHVKGDVHCSDHVELAAKANVDGNVHYNLIEMVKGAQLNGNLVYAGAAAKLAGVEAISGNNQQAG